MRRDRVAKQKKLHLKKWLEKTLVLINTMIFGFLCMVNDFDFKGFIIILWLLVVFGFNALIISKYGRILKELK